MAKTGQYGPILPVDPVVLTSGTIEFQESASHANKRGTPVVIDANGRVDEAGTSFGAAGVYGISANEGNNGSAGANNQLVWPIKKGSRWEITLDGVLALTDIGDKVGLVKDGTTGYWYGAVSDGGDQVLIVDYVKGPGGYDIGDTKARVIVEFIDSVLQGA